MTALFADLDQVSRLFGSSDYAAALPLLDSLHGRDPGNPSVALRLAVAHSSLGHDDEALRNFATARRIDAESLDARHYEAMHHPRMKRPEVAVPLFEAILARQTHRLTALEGLGEAEMKLGHTDSALIAYERARAIDPEAFTHDLELGVLYLAARRFVEAAACLDRVESNNPDYPLALFKRAQVAVLLQEPDAGVRIQLARDLATPETRQLIAREKLFSGL